ncbi:hypothetical protein [Aliarcobacter lanthieri]|uniref:hypothetical protein n=1 Tax=Aliarcobacter lanthieri TaxID=1355374 RepID=UPI003AAFB810
MSAKEQLLKDAKPIIFNTEMVKAILEERKKQTRRICNIPKGFNIKAQGIDSGNAYGKNRAFIALFEDKDGFTETIKSKYKVGDILYVKETFAIDNPPNINNTDDVLDNIIYKVDNTHLNYKWKPSVHMPKKYARIFLKVTNVKVERLQDISDEDCIREGIISEQSGSDSYVTYYGKPDWENYTNIFTDYTRDGELISLEKLAFKSLWNSTAKDGYKWEDNPYVFVYEFERVELV